VSIIGNPGVGGDVLDNTMSQGIISHPKRKLDGLVYIQTTAAINRGTSGGPMFNDKGKVIGIVVSKVNIENVGFAIPSDVVVTFLKSCTR
jgi:serine protease Do